MDIKLLEEIDVIHDLTDIKLRREYELEACLALAMVK